MISLRIHHIYDFVHAAISESYRKQYLLDCHSKKHSASVKNILYSISDDVGVALTTGLDSICEVCPHKSNEACKWSEGLWDSKALKMLWKVKEGEIATMAYLKKQYLLYQNVKNRKDWKQIIINSRKTNC